MIQAYAAIGIGLIPNGGILEIWRITLVRPRNSRQPIEKSEEPKDKNDRDVFIFKKKKHQA